MCRQHGCGVRSACRRCCRWSCSGEGPDSPAAAPGSHHGPPKPHDHRPAPHRHQGAHHLIQREHARRAVTDDRDIPQAEQKLPDLRRQDHRRGAKQQNASTLDAPQPPLALQRSVRESKNLEEAGCVDHGPGKADEKDRQGIIADEKGKKRYGVHRSTGKRCECGTPNCGGQNCTKMSEGKSEKERLEKQIDDRTKRLEAAQSRDENDRDKRRIASLKRAIAKDKQALAKLENVNEGKSEKCEKCANCGCKGKGCVKCDNCKDCNPVDKSKNGKKKDGNKSTSKYDDNPKLKGGQANLPDALQKGIIQAAESKIYTPEQEQELYESRFNDRNDRIFDKLKKLWTK